MAIVVMPIIAFIGRANLVRHVGEEIALASFAPLATSKGRPQAPARAESRLSGR